MIVKKRNRQTQVDKADRKHAKSKVQNYKPDKYIRKSERMQHRLYGRGQQGQSGKGSKGRV